MALEDIAEDSKDKATKLGFHEDIIAPFIGLVAVSTVAWVFVLIVLGRDKA
jgi:hypothetical protein